MMDRDAAARMHRDTRQQQATVNGLVHRAKAAEARVAELEHERDVAYQSVQSIAQTLKEVARQRDSARMWAVRMESEAAGLSIALFSSNPADQQWCQEGGN